MPTLSQPPQTSRDLLQTLLQLEQELRLFDRRFAGAHVWEYCRLIVYYELNRRLGLLATPKLGKRLRLHELVRAAAHSAGSLLLRNPLLARRPCDVLMLGYPRRTLREDGRYSDVHFDPWLDRSAHRHLYLEPLHRLAHARPSATREALHHDVFDWASLVRQRLARPKLSAAEQAELAHIERAFQQRFGVPVRVAAVVRDMLARRHSLVPLYQRWLAKLRPMLVLVVSPNWREMALVEAARSLGIRTAELQHGVFGRCDPCYTFPAGAGQLRCCADDLLVYGPLWTQQLEPPVPFQRVVEVGFAHFEQQVARYCHVAPENTVLFLSQAFIGEKLSRMALDLARRPEYAGRVVYRLHPDERNWQERYPHLLDAPLTVDTGQRTSLYESLFQARAAVGSSSLALYEAIALGRPTYVANLPGVEYMDPVLRTGAAQLVHGHGDIPVDLPPIADRPSSEIFQRGAVDNLLQYIDAVIAGRDGKRRVANQRAAA